MAILPDWMIRARCDQPDPMVWPFNDELINPASIDVRLGQFIKIESAQGIELITIDLQRIGVTEAEPWMLRAGQFILAETMEQFALPDTIAGQFMLKSSRAREGLEHLMAGYFDPGYRGRPTLELVNSRQLWSVPIWPGMKIGQVVFHTMEQAPLQSYAQTGRYQGDQQVQESRG